MSAICIQVINPNTSLAMTETIGAAARAVAAPGTEILAVCPRAGVPSIEATLTKPSRRSACWSRSRPDASRGWMGM